MRGHLIKVDTKRKPLKKGEFTWRIVLSLGKRADGKYKQKWHTFHGTRKEAEAKQNELVGEIHKGDFVETSQLTVGTSLTEWLNTAIQGRKALNTCVAYRGIVTKHLIPAFGHVPLQKLSALHVERYYALQNPRSPVEHGAKQLCEATLAAHHAVLSAALRAAVKKKLLRTNVARLIDNRPRVRPQGDVLTNVWTIDDAKAFMTHVKTNSTAQDAALFALALDSGARKAELLGLRWTDVQGNMLHIEQQLLRGGKTPVFGPPKRGGVRSLDLSAETVSLLQAHKREQSELKMRNRTVYKDYGLIFAQTWESSSLGGPMNVFSVGTKLTQACKAAKVKEITPHGLRHSCATLLLAAGVPAHVVQRRLGHKKVEMTLGVYSHVLPSMQQDAAAKLAALLHR